MENMVDITEPPEKKFKVDPDCIISSIKTSKTIIKAVLNDDVYTTNVPTEDVFVGIVKDRKNLSTIIRVLNEKVPLNNLGHLKRAHKMAVVLCSVKFLDSLPQESIQDFILHHIPELSNVFDYFKVVDVPAVPMVTKQQNLEWKYKWPCNFHPNIILEKHLSNTYFMPSQLDTHRQYMTYVFEVSKWYLSKTKSNITLNDFILSNINAAVVVDPKLNSIVTFATDNRQNHPVQHATMLAIDNVAKTQNGGAWEDTDSISGIDKNLLSKFKQKYLLQKIGYKPYTRKDDKDNIDGPYLCTGYDIYLLREPCFMCAMGLVHARVKRIFFAIDNKDSGALKSKTKLHYVAGLNHRFEVYTNFLDYGN